MPADLDMALDDMIETSWGKGGKNGKGKGRGKGKTSTAGKGYGGQGQKLDMTLDEIVDTSSDGKGKSKGKGKEKSNGSWENWGGKSSGKSSNFGGSSWNGGGSSKGGKSGWGKSNKDNSSKGSSGGSKPYWMEHDDWRGDEDNADDSSWGPPPRSGGWSRSNGYDDYNDSWSKGWGKGSKGSHDDRQSWASPRSLPADGRGYAVGSASSWRRVEDEPEARALRSGGAGRRGSALAAVATAAVARAGVGEKRPRPARRGRDDDDDEDEDVRPPPRTRVRTVAAQVRSAPKSIKVTNIPKELKAADVREAFESETGKVVLCELSRGTARITFAKAKDAQKAVDTFDRGELNGKIITVVLEN